MRTLDFDESSVRSLADVLPALAMIGRSDGTVAYFNAAWREHTGQPLDDPDAWSSYIHPDDLDAVAADWFDAIARDLDALESRFRLRRAVDGSYQWFRARAHALRDDDGRTAWWIGLAMEDNDVIELETAYALLASSTARLQTLSASNIIGIVCARISDGTILEANDAYLRMIGYTRADFEAGIIDWRSLTAPESIAADVRALEEIRERGNCSPFEKQTIHKDGSRSWILVGAAQLSADGDEAVCYTLDITHAKSVEAALAQANRDLADSERHYHAFADAIPIIAWTSDHEGSVDWLNRTWFEYTGLTEAQSLGWGWQGAVPPDDLTRIMSRPREAVIAGEPYDIEYRVRGRDGNERWFLARVTALHADDGRVVRWYGTLTDVDDQKRELERNVHIAERLQRASLPEALPERFGVRFDATYQTAERPALIGGDWYDAFDLPDGRIGISIGDVAGHGLEASVVVGQLRQAIQTLMMECGDPALVLSKVNRTMVFQKQPLFATAVVAVLETDLASLSYAVAGHPPPLVARAATAAVEELQPGGTPLGVVADLQTTTHCLALHEGDVLAFFTDGLIESRRDLLADEKRLASTLRDAARVPENPHPAKAIASTLVPEGHGRDDVALLVVQRSTVPAERASNADRRWSWRFHSGDANTARSVRHDVMRRIAIAAGHDDVYAAEIIVGEMLANVVQHAPSFVEIVVDWRADLPVVSMVDSGPGIRNGALPVTQDDLSEHGRGLFLIEQLAARASLRSLPDCGCEIVVTLPIERRA